MLDNVLRDEAEMPILTELLSGSANTWQQPTTSSWEDENSPPQTAAAPAARSVTPSTSPPGAHSPATTKPQTKKQSTS